MNSWVRIDSGFISPFVDLEEDPKGLEKFARARQIPVQFYMAEGAEFDGLE